MECHRAQHAMLESFVEPASPDMQLAIEAHIAGCASCGAFAAAQRALDRQLDAALKPSSLSPGFRAALRTRVEGEKRTLWSDLLPDAVHFASCGVVTVLGLVFLPLSAPVVLALAAAGTVLSHVLLTAAHDSLDAAEDTVF